MEQGIKLPLKDQSLGIGSTTHSETKVHESEDKCSSNTMESNARQYGSTALPKGTAHHPTAAECHCHPREHSKVRTRARNKLIIAAALSFIFMMAEMLGGYFSNSLAILTDAAHMMSDLAGFLVSLFAIWLAARPATKRLSFGWHRAEVIGAIVSVLLICVLTGVIVYEAILRVINTDYVIDADVMLIISCAGVFLNVFWLVIQRGLNNCDATWSFAFIRVDPMGVSRSRMCSVLNNENDEEKEVSKARKNRDAEKALQLGTRRKNSISKDSEDENKLASFESGEEEKRQQKTGGGTSAENINLRAAMLNVLRDMVQSVGVVIAAFIIKFKPEWKLADPTCTFLFSVLVLFSTVNILRDALLVLMEGTPMDVDFDEIRNALLSVKGVRGVHNLGIWSLTLNKTAVAAHLVLDVGASPQSVLREATALLRDDHNISHTILQTEEHESFMENCSTCRNVPPPRACWSK